MNFSVSEQIEGLTDIIYLELMYNISYFKEKDHQVILDFIEQFPFAFLTGSFLSGEQVATQVPVILVEREGELYLQGHIMRNTGHHKALMENPNALLVFTGPNCYVSASWYSNPQMGSTWNYMSVQVKGKIRFLSPEELVQFMRRFTLKFEKDNAASPTIYDNLSDEYTGKMMPAIAGFEIKADQLENVFKLSQNRDQLSYDNIISRLEAIGGDSARIATEMSKRRGQLFPPGTTWDPDKFDS